MALGVANKLFRVVLGCAAALWLCFGAAAAGPWAEVGDAQLRSDIEILAADGVIDNITMQWPLPWGGILNRLDRQGALRDQPAYVVDAAMRVRALGMKEPATHQMRASVSVDATNGPAVVRGFDALGRQVVQGQVSVEYLWNSTAVHLAVGARTTNPKDRQVILLDGSYIAQRIGNAAVYAGYMTHWWGPGWISALSLSNNARPFPQVGITRVDTTPFQSSWLRWLGPWQVEFFVGWLDGKRISENTLLNGFRFSFSPLPGLEIGLARTDEFCGTGHPCKPIATYFDIRNDRLHPSRTNDEGNIDIRYSGTIGRQLYAIYAQFMNEDTNPFIHSGTSHLFGATTWVPVGATRIRLTAEYTDSIATKDLWSFGNDFYGVAYHDYKYLDGMRYRDRTIGFSLDSDSRLATLQASWIGPNAITYTLTYHHAAVGSPQSPGTNVVTTSPVTINIGEARVHVPLRLGERNVQFDIVGRLQDDQPRPDKGFLATVEAALTVNL